MINKSKIFEVYEDNKGRLYTVNLTPGKVVYDERLVREKGIEYREWNARKSKLAATILNGCSNVFIRKGDVVLYLGCSSGTTVSHVSDIVGENGFVFALDLAPRMMRDMVFVAEDRENISPILADANRPEQFIEKVCQADIIYQDISQRNQVEIFLKNINLFLKKDGYALLAVKARSIDVTKKPKQLFSEMRQRLEKEVTVVDYKTLEPYQLDHCMFVCKKK